MKTSSAKNKGRRAQQEVIEKIKKQFPDINDMDIVSTPMGVTGTDVYLSSEAASNFPFAIEVKNQEKLAIWSALEQSEDQNRDVKDKHLTPLLVFKRNRSEMYCALKFDTFLELIKNSSRR